MAWVRQERAPRLTRFLRRAHDLLKSLLRSARKAPIRSPSASASTGPKPGKVMDLLIAHNRKEQRNDHPCTSTPGHQGNGPAVLYSRRVEKFQHDVQQGQQN